MLDLFFYIYGLISFILILMIIFIINKSTDFANVSFIITPLLFTAILIFNMLNYFGALVNNFLLWFPYLIAPLGMLFSSLYILQGSGFHKNKYLLIGITLYVFIALILSSYPNPFQFAKLDGFHVGIMHLLLVIPFLITIFDFWKLIPQVQNEKTKIYLLDSGLGFSAIGSLLRSFNYLVTNNDSTLGMILIVIGAILAMSAFIGVNQKQSSK